MTYRRQLAGALALAAFALAAPAATTGATAAARPATLAGVTTFRASAPVLTDVRLPRAVDVRTPFGSSPDLDVRGGGKLPLLVLVGTDPATRGTTLVGGRFPDRTDPTRFLLPVPVFPAVGGGTFEQIKTFGDVTRLPAGAYRAYVVPDGPAVAVTLRLPGLSGTTTLRPTRRAGAVIQGAGVPTAGTVHNALAIANGHTLGSTGLALQALWLDTAAHGAAQVVMCHNTPGAGREAVPGCPNGEKHSIVNDRAPTTARDSKLYLQGYAGLPKGEHELSTVYAAESVVTDSEYRTLWLTY